jgi:hypothetical protein
MRHPVEMFDTELLRLMTEALEASTATLRLGGGEPSSELRIRMARRVAAEAAQGTHTRLSLAEAALSEAWT